MRNERGTDCNRLTTLKHNIFATTAGPSLPFGCTGHASQEGPFKGVPGVASEGGCPGRGCHRVRFGSPPTLFLFLPGGSGFFPRFFPQSRIQRFKQTTVLIVLNAPSAFCQTGSNAPDYFDFRLLTIRFNQRVNPYLLFVRKRFWFIDTFKLVLGCMLV